MVIRTKRKINDNRNNTTETQPQERLYEIKLTDIRWMVAAVEHICNRCVRRADKGIHAYVLCPTEHGLIVGILGALGAVEYISTTAPPDIFG